MKKSFMTRVLATGLSLAMALSLSTATNLVSAQAAPAMLVDAVSGESTSTLTVDVDAVAKLKINPEVSKTYKVESVKKSSKKIKTAVSKNGTVVYVRGVTATEEKDSAIRVYFKVKKTGKTAKRQFTAKVKVVAPKPAVAELTEVTQKEARKFAVTLSTAVEKVDASDFSVVRKADNAVIPIKSAISDDAKTGVTIETFVDLADGKEYTFTYTAKDEAKTASSKDLTVTAGKIEKLDLTTTNVTAGTADDGVKVVTKDANGVILNTYSFSDAAAKYINVTVTPTTAGYRDGNKIFLPEVGNTAAVKVEYHTYKYDANNVEVGALNETFTVTAVADATVMNNFAYTIKTDDSKEPAWSSASFKENHQISIGDANQVIYFKFKDSKGNDKTKGYKVSTSDAKVLIMNAMQLNNGSADKVAVAGANAGTAYIVVKNSKDELVTTLPVTVAAKKVATNLELSTQAVTLSNSTTAQVTKDVTLVVKDQFGNKINLASPNPSATTKVAISALSGPTGFDAKNDTMNKAAVKSLAGVAVGTGSYQNISNTGTDTKLTVNGKEFNQKGTYVYKIDITVGDKTVSNSLTVNVSEPNASGTESYTIQLSTDSIDLVANDNNKAAKRVEIKVAKLKDGVVSDFLKTNSITSISVKSSDGSSTLDVVSAGAATCGAVISTGSGTQADPIVKKAKKDTTYLVKISLQGNKDLTASFTTKDSQLALVSEITNISDSISDNGIKDVLAFTSSNKDKARVKYSYDNSDLYIESGQIKKVNAAYVANSKDITVYSIDVNAKIGNTYVQFNVPINKPFTTTASNGWSDPNA